MYRTPSEKLENLGSDKINRPPLISSEVYTLQHTVDLSMSFILELFPLKNAQGTSSLHCISVSMADLRESEVFRLVKFTQAQLTELPVYFPQDMGLPGIRMRNKFRTKQNVISISIDVVNY